MHLKSRILATALLSSLITPSLASAELTVKLGGTMDVMAGSRQQKPAYRDIYTAINNNGRGLSKAVVTDGKVNINIDSTEENNFKYGGLLVLNANPSDSTTGEKGLVSKSMIYLQHSKIGRLEAGNYYGAGGMFEMTSSNFAKAGYGVDGYWSSWINDIGYVDLTTFGMGKQLVAGTMPYEYLYSPSLPSNYSGKHYAAAPKVTYYAIPFPGLTMGVSYIPDLDSTGTISTQAGAQSGPKDAERSTNRPTFKNIISGGFMYEVEVAAVKIKTSLAGEIGKAKKYYGTNLSNNLKAYEIGLGVTYGEYSVGGTYGSWGKTGTYRQRYAGTKQGANYWTAVIAQQKEQLGYSLSYMQSKRAGGLEAVGSNLQSSYSLPIAASSTFSSTSYNSLKVISLGVDYKFAPGLMPYVEGTRFIFKNKSDPKSNSGYVILTGMRLSF